MAAQQVNPTPIYPPPSVVGNAFVSQYYQVLRSHPEHVFRFYQEASKLGRPGPNGEMSCTTTLAAINEKIVSHDYGEFKAEIKTVDSQDSFEGGVLVLVTGALYGENSTKRNFAQTFFLAPQEKGYFVLNDVFRYVDDAASLISNGSSAQNSDTRSCLEPVQEAAPEREQHSVERDAELVEETVVEDVHVPTNSVEEPVGGGEVSPPSQVSEATQNEQLATGASSVSQEEDTSKKSYASIVKRNKERKAQSLTQQSAPQQSSQQPSVSKGTTAVVEPQPALPNDSPSDQEMQAPTPSVPDNNSSSDTDNRDGRSIYVKNLPLNATSAKLHEEFKRFGTIKQDGVQVRSNKMAAFCYGFVEFESSVSAQRAIEASPLTIGTRVVHVEEKRASSTRAVRGRFVMRGSYRNDGNRGRGSYGGRGYGRGDFARNDVSRMVASRATGALEGYQRVDHFGNGSRGGRPRGAGSYQRSTQRGGS